MSHHKYRESITRMSLAVTHTQAHTHTHTNREEKMGRRKDIEVYSTNRQFSSSILCAISTKSLPKLDTFYLIIAHKKIISKL